MSEVTYDDLDLLISHSDKLSKIASTEDKILKALDKRKTFQEQINKLNELADDANVNSLKTDGERLVSSMKQMKLVGEQQINLYKLNQTHEDIIKQLGLQDKIENQLNDVINENIDNYGERLLQQETFNENLLKTIKFQELVNEQVKELKKNSVFEVWGKKLKTLRVDANAMMSDWKLSVGALATGVVANTGEFLKSLDSIQSELGLTGSATMEMSGAMASASLQGVLLGYSFGSAADSAKALVEETNDLSLVNGENLTMLSKMNSYYGIAQTESAKLLKVFTEINGNSDSLARNTMDFTIELAKSSGVAPGKLMSEIASDSEQFAGRTAQATQNLIKATATALKLGINMSTLTNIGDGLLDVESSIAAEQEASMLIGRQLNFQKAREAKMRKDEKGMMDAILEQVGSYSDFQSLDIIKQKAMADALSMTVAEMSSVLSNQHKANEENKMSETTWGNIVLQTTRAAKGIWEYKGTAGALLSTLAQVKTIMPGAFSIDGIKKFGKGIKSATMGVWKFIKSLVTQKTTEAAVEKASAVGGSGSKGGLFKKATKIKATKIPKTPSGVPGGPNSIVNWLNGWNYLQPSALLKFGLALGILIISLPLLALALKQFADVPWQGALVGMSSMLVMAGIMKIISTFKKDILMGSLAMGVMSVALIPMAYALQMFSTGVSWEGIGKAVVGMLAFTGMMFGLGALLMSPGALLFGAGVLGFIALGGALLVLGFGMQAISSGMSNMINPLTSIVPLIMSLAVVAPLLFTIGLGFASMGAGLGALALGLLAVTPFLPVLTALNSSANSIGMGSGTDSSNSSKDSKEPLLEKLDVLIGLLIEGGTVQMDGKVMGTWVAQTLDTMNTHPK